MGCKGCGKRVKIPKIKFDRGIKNPRKIQTRDDRRKGKCC